MDSKKSQRSPFEDSTSSSALPDEPPQSGEGPAPIPERPPIATPAPIVTTRWQRVKKAVVGPPRDPQNKDVFHQISLVAFMAWVALGSDGLSSSAYGPEEAFKALTIHTPTGTHDYTYLALALALATAVTVFIISYTYSRVIEQFPHGGGGYSVATQLLGANAGVISGCALVVDYMLTIAISVASGADAFWSAGGWSETWNVPLVHAIVPIKLWFEVVVIAFLVVINLRGVKESVQTLLPIFVVFVVTHLILILGTIISNAGEFPSVGREMVTRFSADTKQYGLFTLVFLFAKAYSLGGGTYTGIEAVSNGMAIMREPRVQTAKKTMVLTASSLAFTAGGIIICYLLARAHHVPGKTMNAVLVEKVAGGLHLGPIPIGKPFVLVTLISEMALLFVAAQASFIGGPRTMANMALDSWVPHRFGSLSDRLTTANGVILMGSSAVAALLWTRGSVAALVIMYSINVFLTFSLSNLGMCRFWIRNRADHPEWKRHFPVHVLGLLLCVTILCVTTVEKFAEGGWLTLAVTGAVIVLCLLVRRHYEKVATRLQMLNKELAATQLLPEVAPAPIPLVPNKPTAVILVSSFSGIGIHTCLNIFKYFPGYFTNLVFASVAVIDSGNFKGARHVNLLQAKTEEMLKKYVAFATSQGLPSTYVYSVGTEPVDAAEALCKEASANYSKTMFFAGQLVFQDERWYHRLLHNNTAYAIQKRLQWDGLPMIILPVRVREG